MGRFTKKPVTVEAHQFNGGLDTGEKPDWLTDAFLGGRIVFGADTDRSNRQSVLKVKTTEGEMIARPGDWIIRGVEGEIYPCKDSVFQATYVPGSRPPDARGEPALTLAETQAVVETKTAPRVTEESIKALIADTEYFRVRHLTICIITLTNGFFVTGESAPAAVENYDQAVGERYAYENAFRKIWPLEGYRLRCDLARDEPVASPDHPRVPRREATFASPDPRLPPGRHHP